MLGCASGVHDKKKIWAVERPRREIGLKRRVCQLSRNFWMRARMLCKKERKIASKQMQRILINHVAQEFRRQTA